MKQLRLLILGILISFVSIGQSVKLDRAKGIFNTIVTDGLEIEVPIKFSIRGETIAKILKSESYQNTCKDKNFLDNKISKDTLALHLMSKVNGAIFSARLELKNRASMQIPEGQTGRIYWSENDGLCISFAIRAQNGFGNMIISEVISNDRITVLTNQ